MTIANIDERKDLQAKIDAVNADARENWEDEKWRKAIAQEMAEDIREGFDHENMLSIMTTVENAGFNARIVVREVRGLKAHWVARGGYIEASTLRRQTMELQRDTVGFHVYENEEKLLTNFAETQATMIELGTQRLSAQVNARVISLFSSALTASGDVTVAAGLTLSDLNEAMRSVRDESKVNQIAIVGRSTMTDQIHDLLLGAGLNGSGFLPETNEELVRRGLIGTYRNAPIVTLVNHKDDNDVSFFPANELYVIGRDASKFAFWGGMMVRQYSEQDAWYWHYIAKRDFGGVVHRPERAHLLQDSSITP